MKTNTKQLKLKNKIKDISQLLIKNICIYEKTFLIKDKQYPQPNPILNSLIYTLDEIEEHIKCPKPGEY